MSGSKKFQGSVGWLIFWILICWPVAIYYYFSRKKVEHGQVEVKPAESNTISTGKLALITVVSIVGGGILFAALMNDATSSNVGNTQNTKVAVMSDDFAQFHSSFFSGTDLQREELWKSYKGKTVLWSFYVKNIDKDVFGTVVVLGRINPIGQYDITSDIAVRFAEGQEKELLRYYEGDLMTVQGTLASYGDTFKSIDLKDAKILPNRGAPTAQAGSTQKPVNANPQELTKAPLRMPSKVYYSDFEDGEFVVQGEDTLTKEEQYFEQAKAERDWGYCMMIGDFTQRERCITHISIQEGNATWCSLIAGLYDEIGKTQSLLDAYRSWSKVDVYQGAKTDEELRFYLIETSLTKIKACEEGANITLQERTDANG